MRGQLKNEFYHKKLRGLSALTQPVKTAGTSNSIPHPDQPEKSEVD
jgi:hypothetical protein